MELARDDVYDAVLDNDLDSLRFIMDRIQHLSYENLKFVDDLLVFAIGHDKIESVKILVKEYNANVDINRQSIRFLMESSKVSYPLKQYLLHGDEDDCECDD